MNSTQAAESSADPKLLAGYPAVKNIAPNSATLVFRTNKTGTIYWAISAVADGSVSEADLMEPPVYGGNVLQSGTINATSANTDFTAAVTGLTKDGSYYVTAMLVDGRDNHSPIKVTSFSTPDDTVPAFNQGYPYMSRITTENSQVTVSTNKSCLLYYALLPKGSTAPTPAEFKANAISGNLGYGTIDTVKNVTQPFQVNSTRLKELTDYTLYLWLTDYSGAKSSAVISLDFTTPDEQPPVIVSADPAPVSENSAQLTFSLNEAGTLYWAVVPEGMTPESLFEGIDEDDWKPANVADNISDPNDRRLQIKTENGAGNAILKGSQAVRAGYTNAIAQVRNLDTATYGSSFTMYIVAKDAAGNYSKVQKLTIRVKDTTPPTVTLQFDPENESNPKQPSVTATAQLVFSEKVKGSGKSDDFETLYNEVTKYENDPINQANALNAWGAAVARYITLYYGPVNNNGSAADDRRPVEPAAKECEYINGEIVYGAKGADGHVADNGWLVNYCAAKLTTDRDNHMIIEFPAYDETSGTGALKLTSGTQYHFTVSDVVDLSEEANMLKPNPTRVGLDFTTQVAQVELNDGVGDIWTISKAKDKDGKEIKFTSNPDNEPTRIDARFWANPIDVGSMDEDILWDMLIWSNTTMTFTLYSRPVDNEGKATGDGTWTLEGKEISVRANEGKVDTHTFVSLCRKIRNLDEPNFGILRNMKPMEYAIHVDKLDGDNANFKTWNNQSVNLRVSVVADTRKGLRDLSIYSYKDQYDSMIAPSMGGTANGTVMPIGVPNFYNYPLRFSDTSAPSIQTDYPKLIINEDNGDTTVRIDVRLNNPGTLYYMIFPLESLVGANNVTINTKEVALTEDVIKDVVKGYSAVAGINKAADGNAKAEIKEMPLMSGDPRLGAGTASVGLAISEPTMDNLLKNDLPDTILGNGDSRNTKVYASRNTSQYIDLTDKLTPNTVYAVCLMTQGISDVFSPDVKCFRFVTMEPIRPTIDVQVMNGTDTYITVSKNTNLSYFLVLNDQESSVFREPFTNRADMTKWYSTSNAGKWDVEDANDIKTGECSVTLNGLRYYFTYLDAEGKPKDIRNMTVIDAMATRCLRGSGNGVYVGTVFDVFAKNESKDAIEPIIRGSAVGSGGYGAQDKYCGTSQENKIDFSSIDPGSYTFISVGKSAQGGSGAAFRAYYSVVKSGNDHPVVNGAPVTTPAGQGWDTKTGTYTGQITLNFNEKLYALYGTGYKARYEVDNCLMGATDHTMALAPITVTGNEKQYVALGWLANATTDNVTEGITVGNLGDKHATKTVIDTQIVLKLNSLSYEPASDVDKGREYELFFKAGLCNFGSKGAEDPLSVKVYLVRTLKPGAATGSTDINDYNYTPKLEVTSSKWNGLSN